MHNSLNDYLIQKEKKVLWLITFIDRTIKLEPRL